MLFNAPFFICFEFLQKINEICAKKKRNGENLEIWKFWEMVWKSRRRFTKFTNWKEFGTISRGEKRKELWAKMRETKKRRGESTLEEVVFSWKNRQESIENWLWLIGLTILNKIHSTTKAGSQRCRENNRKGVNIPICFSVAAINSEQKKLRINHVMSEKEQKDGR